MAWLEASARFPGNPSSPHRLGTRASHAVEEARERLAARLGCGAHEIVWTGGATEAINTAVAHLATLGGNAWVSAIEHPAMLESAKRWFGERVHTLPITKPGSIDLAALERVLSDENPGFVALMAANNETGILQPWQDALALCRRWRGVPFLCDAAQWLGKLPAAGFGACDLVSGCGHKFGGPQGVGFLKCSTRLRPLLVGGPQEEGRRAGTENVAGILAMVAALEAREDALARGALKDRTAWRDAFVAGLPPGSRLVGAGGSRLWNTISVVLPALEGCQRWVVKLDKHLVAASTGSACASGKEQISHVLAAMGLPPEEAGRVIRFSSGWETTEEDWRQLGEVVRTIAS